MRQLRIIALTAIALAMLAPASMAQRRGGAASSGVRGAMVGGLVGGESGAQKGAKIGVVAGATRSVVQSAEQRQALDAEAQTRAQYEASAQYQDAQHSNFNEAPPEVFVTSPQTASGAPVNSVSPSKEGEPVEAVIRLEGKPVMGITYPADWKQTAGKRYVSAVSADGQGWSAIALLEGVKDKPAGITKTKQELEKSLLDIKYDEPTETERGALVVTGTGKGKKSGVEVVFAIGVFEPGAGRVAGAAFIVDKEVEELYKETVLYTCQTIRGEESFAKTKDAGK